MVHINANLVLQTNEVIKTERLFETFYDLNEEEEVRITFVARDRKFLNEAWQEEGETFMRVVLPYREELSANNIDLLVAEELYKQLDKLKWLDVERMKRRLEGKISKMQ